MLKYVVYTCRLHICDMFDEMPVMASRGPVKVLFKYLLLHHFSFVIFFSEGVIEFWAVTWALGLKKWLNPGDAGTTLEK
jgi:hypothetical protein